MRRELRKLINRMRRDEKPQNGVLPAYFFDFIHGKEL